MQKRSSAKNVIHEIRKIASQERATTSKRFFKTGPGEYGEGDQFIGITMPQIRLLAKKFQDMTPTEFEKLMRSLIHEERMLGFIICTQQFKHYYKNGNSKDAESRVQSYLKHKRYLNNWDLIDVTAPHILGTYFLDRDRAILKKWITSSSMWDRRLALLTTQQFIRNETYHDTIALCRAVLSDHEDLIHKASGWMLREIGKKNITELRTFLDQYSQKMPRTMLRYAIEKLSDSEKKKYLGLSSKTSR